MSCVRCNSNNLHHSPVYEHSICKDCYVIFETKKAEIQQTFVTWAKGFLAIPLKQETPTEFSEETEESPMLEIPDSPVNYPPTTPEPTFQGILEEYLFG